MVNNKTLIGYELNYAIDKFLKGITKQLIIETTKTPLNYKLEERKHNEPVVIKHIENDERITLTISYFK